MFTYGADPELFIQDTSTGAFVSAETANGPIIPGTKQDPYEVKGGAIQVDGVATEFNINPTDKFDVFITNIIDVVGDLRKRVQAVDKNFILSPTPTAHFDKDYFKSLPEHTLELGCEPDFDATQGGKENPRPSTTKPFRTGSGHIHIGGWAKDAKIFSEEHMTDCVMIVKELDRYLYYASLDWDNDQERRSLYGSKGSFRPKPFGVEYRPLSNVWLKNQETVEHVFNITNAVMKSLDSGKHQFKNPEDSYGKTNVEKVYNTLGGYIY